MIHSIYTVIKAIKIKVFLYTYQKKCFQLRSNLLDLTVKVTFSYGIYQLSFCFHNVLTFLVLYIYKYYKIQNKNQIKIN